MQKIYEIGCAAFEAPDGNRGPGVDHQGLGMDEKENQRELDRLVRLPFSA